MESEFAGPVNIISEIGASHTYKWVSEQVGIQVSVNHALPSLTSISRVVFK
jgi:hypothetical protein